MSERLTEEERAADELARIGYAMRDTLTLDEWRVCWIEVLHRLHRHDVYEAGVIRRLALESAQLREEVARLREALDYYAVGHDFDGGRRARGALAAPPREGGSET